MPSAVENWSRRLHIYIGLYFLFFTWLFCLSGVVLNHPGWRIAGFWNERRQTSAEIRIARHAADTDSEVAKDLMTQLRIRGEISGTITRDAAGTLGFRVVRPGDIYEVKADFDSGVAAVNRIHVNGWGVLNMLHSFTGVRRTDPSLHQNWWATGLWRCSMDALSVGLVFMVLSGIYVWYRRARQRRSGALSLALGILTLAVFLAC